jgi:hypothetical protein
MAALNYYLGVKRGAGNQPDLVVAGQASAATAVDVEVRIQINDGTDETGITRKDVNTALCTIEGFINGGGLNHAGANLPKL